MFEPDEISIKSAKNRLYEKNITIKRIVNLSKNFQIDTDIPQKHLVEYAHDANQEYREKSNKWIQDIAKVKLHSGKSLLEELTHNGISLWWFVELGLQEKIFRIIRFIETILYVLEKEKVENVSIIGEWEEEWTKTILNDICKLQKKKIIELDIKTNMVREDFPDKEIRIIGKIQSNKRKLFKKILFIISSPLVGLFFTFLMKKNKDSQRKNSGSTIKATIKRWINSPSQLSLIQICSYIAATIGVREELNDFIGKKIVDPYHKYGSMLLNYYHNTRGKYLNFRKDELEKRKISNKDILIVCETDAIKQRTRLENHSKIQYNPYLENIPKSISIGKGKLNFSCIYYGGGRKIPKIINEKPYKFQSFFEQKHYLIIDELNKKIKTFIEKLQKDKNFSSSLNYKGINLSEILIKEICLGYENSSHFVFYMEVFENILNQSNPSVVIMNNYEGTFRSMIAACKINNIATLGIQQALGPYVHALKKFEPELDELKKSTNLAFPKPQTICLWGNKHKEKFLEYGFNENNLIVTGYSRLDTFVNEKKILNSKKIKKRLLLPENSKIIMYTGTFHPPGVYVTLEDHYIQTLKELVKFTNNKNTYVLVKPWAGDKINDIINFIKKYGNEKTIFVHPSTDIHNVDLLAITDITIGSYSSIFAESITMGCKNIFLNYPEAQFYDEISHIKLIENLVETIDSPKEVFDKVKLLLNSDSQDIRQEEFEELFGPMDGKSSDRILKTIIDQVLKNKNKY